MSRTHERAAPAPILYVHSGQDWIRGSERALLDLVAGVDRIRFRPIVWCDSEVLGAEARSCGADVEVTPGAWRSAGASLLPDRDAVRRAREMVRRHAVRLVHVNDEMPVKSLLPACRAARIPALLHLHLTLREDERCYSGAHQLAMVVGVSRSAAQGFADDGMPASRVRVVHNGVDPRRLSAGDATTLRAQLGVARDDVVIAAVGSLIARKGVDTLLRAFAILRGRAPAAAAAAATFPAPRVRLLVVGDGPERASLESLARELGVADAVHFLGERRDAGAILRDAVDVAASAAREEAFPLNLLEAALFGLPVVASAIPPHHESIVPGETGLLAALDDPAALADALHALVADPALRRRLGDAGRARIEGGFLVSHFVSAFESLYDDLLRRPPSSYGWLHGTTVPRIYWRWLGRALRRRRLPGGGGGRAIAPARS